MAQSYARFGSVYQQSQDNWEIDPEGHSGPYHPNQDRAARWINRDANSPIRGIFALADGHAQMGEEAAKFSTSNLLRDSLKMFEQFEAAGALPDDATLTAKIDELFINVDERFKQSELADRAKREADPGCTAEVVVVYGNRVIMANCGDSRTVLLRQRHGKHWTLAAATDDHDTASSDVERAVSEGGALARGGAYITAAEKPADDNVPFKRIGLLAMTRAIGNFALKKGGVEDGEGGIVTAHPDVGFIDMKPGERYVLVMASDGLWDHINPRDERNKLQDNRDALRDAQHRRVLEIVGSEVTRDGAFDATSAVKDMLDDCKKESHAKGTPEIPVWDDITIVCVELGVDLDGRSPVTPHERAEKRQKV